MKYLWLSNFVFLSSEQAVAGMIAKRRCLSWSKIGPYLSHPACRTSASGSGLGEGGTHLSLTQRGQFTGRTAWMSQGWRDRDMMLAFVTKTFLDCGKLEDIVDWANIFKKTVMDCFFIIKAKILSCLEQQWSLSQPSSAAAHWDSPHCTWAEDSYPFLNSPHCLHNILQPQFCLFSLHSAPVLLNISAHLCQY